MSQKEVVIDGERFVRACDSGPIKIVVLERGFVYVGRVDQANDSVISAAVTIHGARCLIRWGTKKHLGQLVDGPLDGTSLGGACTVQCRLGQVIHMIEVSQDGWSKHII